MADGADATDTAHQAWQFVEGPTFDKLFETAELGHMELSIGHGAIIRQLNRYFRVTFDAGHGINQNLVGHLYAPGRVLSRSSGVRPATSSDST